VGPNSKILTLIIPEKAISTTVLRCCQLIFNSVVNSLAVCQCNVHKSELHARCDTRIIKVNIKMFEYSHNMLSATDINRQFHTDLLI
jgi:hypothetical protein